MVQPVLLHLLHLLELSLKLILPLCPLLGTAHIEQLSSHLLPVHVHHSLGREDGATMLGNHPQ